MLLGLLATTVIAIAITTFFLVYNDSSNDKKENKEDFSLSQSSGNIQDERVNEQVKNISPIPTTTVSYGAQEPIINAKEKRNKKVNIR